MKKEISDKQGIILVFLGGLCWGFSGACGEYIFNYKNVGADFLVPYRLLFAGMFMLLFCKLRNIKIDFQIFKNKKDFLHLLLFAFFGIWLCQFTYFYGIELSNAAIATVIQYTAPIFIILYTCYEEKRRIKSYEIIALILMLVGVILLATNGDFTNLFISLKALIICFLSAFGAFCYAIMPRRLNKIYSPLPILGFSMLIAGIIFCLKMQIWNAKVNMDLELFLAMLGVIIVGTVMAFGFFMVGLNKIGAAKASIIASNEPLAAAIFSYIWLGSSLFAIQIIGFALIMIAILITMFKGNK